MAASAGADEREGVTGPRVPFDPLDFAYSIPLADDRNELLLIPFPLGPRSSMHGNERTNPYAALAMARVYKHTGRPSAAFVLHKWVVYSDDCDDEHTVEELIVETGKLARAYEKANGSPKKAYGYEDFSDEFHFLVRRKPGG